MFIFSYSVIRILKEIIDIFMKCSTKCLGGILLSFGVGLMLSVFTPNSVIIVIEAIIISIAGFVLFK